ncbi:hypothetical protein Tco_1389447, partial [Tanacetum coccineum]
GRYNCCCPMMSVCCLHIAWPEAMFKETTSADDSMQQLSSFNADIAAKQIATEDAREVNLAHSPQRQPEAEKQKMQFNKGRTRGLREGRSESISVIRVLKKYVRFIM